MLNPGHGSSEDEAIACRKRRKRSKNQGDAWRSIARPHVQHEERMYLNCSGRNTRHSLGGGLMWARNSIVSFTIILFPCWFSPALFPLCFCLRFTLCFPPSSFEHRRLSQTNAAFVTSTLKSPKYKALHTLHPSADHIIPARAPPASVRTRE